MFRFKTLGRVTAFLLLTLVICAGASASVHMSFEPLPETTADDEYSETPIYFVSCRRMRLVLGDFDSPQIMKLSSPKDVEMAGGSISSQRISISGQTPLGGRYGPFRQCPFFIAADFAERRISVLAFSLGGNSPPVQG